MTTLGPYRAVLRTPAEAYTWLSSANAAGIAVGGAAAGAIIDAHGTAPAFAVAAALAVVAAAAAR